MHLSRSTDGNTYVQAADKNWSGGGIYRPFKKGDIISASD